VSFRGPDRLRLHRPVDLLVALVGGILTLPVTLLAVACAAVSTRSSGIFRQNRVGRNGEIFTVYKVQTMRAHSDPSTVTTADDRRITPVGGTMRRFKIDELPQLVNVARGEMALLGPRPDVAGFADLLKGGNRRVLEVRPGITGPATLLMRDEEQMLVAADDAEQANREVLYPIKTAVNRSWIESGTLWDDARLLVWTVFSPSEQSLYRLFDRWDPTLRASSLFRRLQEMSA